MNLSETDQYLIEKHLDNTLTPAEQAQFEQRLVDAAFAAEVQRYKDAVRAVYALGDARLKALLQEEEALLSQQTPPQYDRPKRVITWQRLAIAATVALVMGVGTWFWWSKTAINRPVDGIFAANFEPFKNFEYPTVRDHAATTDLERAFSAYDNRDFTTATQHFAKIIPPQYNSDFFQANAYLASQQAEKAIPILEKIAATPDAKYRLQAEWYLALAYAKLGNAERAKAYLQTILSNADHPFYAKARGLRL